MYFSECERHLNTRRDRVIVECSKEGEYELAGEDGGICEFSISGISDFKYDKEQRTFKMKIHSLCKNRCAMALFIAIFICSLFAAIGLIVSNDKNSDNGSESGKCLLWSTKRLIIGQDKNSARYNMLLDFNL